MTTHPLANNLLGKRNVLIVDACDELTKRIRRINRQLNRLDPSDDRAIRLNRTKDKLTITFVELSRLHYEGKTFIPGSIVRYRKTHQMVNIQPHVPTEKSLTVSHAARQATENDLLANCGWKDAMSRGEVNEKDLFRHSLFVTCCDMVGHVVKIIHVKDNTHIDDSYIVTISY